MTENVPTLRKNLDLLGTFLVKERSIIFHVITYAIAVGLFSLIIPLTAPRPPRRRSERFAAVSVAASECATRDV